ncbi:hypothetical protein [Aquisalibacillus elongatus]|nr:hypothetical protein [Aquisalibacillus elongatus]
MTWFYPFSTFSLYKSYTFNPDKVVVDQYVNDLEKFKSSFENDYDSLSLDIDNSLTIDRTNYILQMFDQDWLTNSDSVKVDRNFLSEQLFLVQNTRDYIIELLVREDYTEDQKQYLSISLESMLFLEERIIDLQNDKTHSRKDLRILMGNLYVGFSGNFMMFETFYNLSIHEK